MMQLGWPRQCRFGIRWLIKLMNVMVIIIIVIVECATRDAAGGDAATTAGYGGAHVVIGCGRSVCGGGRGGRGARVWKRQWYDRRAYHAHFCLCQPFLLWRLCCLLLDDLLTRRGRDVLAAFPEGHELGPIGRGSQGRQDAI